jgi:hypothetical protein
LFLPLCSTFFATGYKAAVRRSVVGETIVKLGSAVFRAAGSGAGPRSLDLDRAALFAS